MRRILTIALCALLLSGCVAQWPSNRSGARFTEGPGMQPFYQGGATPMNTPQAQMPMH